MTEMQDIIDPVILAALRKQSIDSGHVELWHDYAPRSRGKEYSPYARVYRDVLSGQRFMAISGLPMIDAFGQSHEPVWRDRNGIIENGNNIFHCMVNNGDVRIVALSDQPWGGKRDDEVVCRPQLFIGGSEVEPVSSTPRLLETDPFNENYHNNVLEWNYGFCKRRVRLIEGRFLGTWVFLTDPGGDVRIRYNQSGKLRLKLNYARNDDEEYLPGEYFDNVEKYPVVISDSATFYPDANPETSSVDGMVRHNDSNVTWGTLVGGGGTLATDSATVMRIYGAAGTTTDRWNYLQRLIFLFDTSALPDDAMISAATLSLYGEYKENSLGAAPTLNIYSSVPASNTALAAGDFDSLGVTAFAVAISYANWNAAGYNDFALNSSGITAISKTGVSKFGAREATYDVPNSAPSWVSGQSFTIGAYAADQGTGYKPKLVVTYIQGEEKASSDTGSGLEVISIRGLGSAEAGAGLETSFPGAAVLSGDSGVGDEMGGLMKTLLGSDGGNGADTIKILMGKAGSDMRLHSHQGRVGIPHKEVSL